MKRLNLICFITLNLYLTACGSSGGSGAEAKSVPDAPGLVQPPVVTPPGPTPFALTYYTLVVNATHTQGGQTYPITMTGHCVQYSSKTYCWDDGWQKIPQLPAFEKSFWGICTLSGTLGICSGGAAIDPVTEPTYWSANITALPVPPHIPADVFTNGIATQVSCTLTGDVVDCVDFQIDTAQAPL